MWGAGQASFFAWMFFALGGGVFIANFLQFMSFGVLAQKLTRKVRVMLLTSILRQDMAFFDDPNNSSGSLVGSLATDSTLVKVQSACCP